MAGAHPHPNGKLAHGEPADAVDARGMIDTEASRGFAQDALGLLGGKRRERLVFERRDLLAFIQIADPAFK